VALQWIIISDILRLIFLQVLERKPVGGTALNGDCTQDCCYDRCNDLEDLLNCGPFDFHTLDYLD
jgi:hypothetical protein